MVDRLFVFQHHMNLEQAKIYPTVRAKAGTTVSVFKKSDYQSNGTVVLSTKLETYQGGSEIGIIQSVYTMKSGKHLALIQLSKPIVKWYGLRYSHVLVFIENLEAIGETGVSAGNTYYCIGNDVNIRKSPRVTAGKFSAKLNKGDIIGTSNGVAVNGYLPFNLRMGGVGYVSKVYCTLQAPSKNITKTIATIDPQTGVQSKEVVPIIPQPESKIDYTRIVIGSVVGVAVGWLFTKIVGFITK